MKPLDLDDPKQARLFLKSLRSGKKGRVTGCQTEDGRWYEFKNLSDEDAVRFAVEIAQGMGILRPKNH